MANPDITLGQIAPPYPEFELSSFGRYDRKRQQSLLNITGTGAITGASEVQDVAYTGSRSNVFTVGNNEVITIDFIDAFDSGVTQTSIPLNFDTESDPVTHAAGDFYSWPTGDIDNGSLPTGWDYTAGGGSGAIAVAGSITNNTGASVSTADSSMSLTIDVTALPASGSTQPTAFMSSGTTILVASFGVITATGSYTATSTLSLTSPNIKDGESLAIFIFEDIEADRGFTYTVTDLQINTGDSSAATYNLDIDTSDAVFVGNIANTFANELTATTALTQIATDTTTMFPTVTAGAVYNSATAQQAIATVSGVRMQTGNISNNNWDLRDSGSNTGVTVDYTSWDDWVGNSFGYGGVFSNLSDLTRLIDDEATFQNLLFFVVDTLDTNNSASFTLSSLVDAGGAFFYNIATVSSQSGTPPTDIGLWSLTLIGDVASKAIDLDTNQTTNIAQSLLLTENTGSDVFGRLTATNGTGDTGQASTYTVTDPYGMEVTSFTSFVSADTESDLQFVITSIVSAINDNIEIPIDFTAASDIDSIDISATVAGVIPGVWIITANHHGQANDAGDITFATAMVTTLGSEVTITLSGAGLNADVVVSGPSLTTAEIIQGLTDNITTGATIYEDPNAQFALISYAFAEEPALSVDVQPSDNSPLTFTPSVKYWGHE